MSSESDLRRHEDAANKLRADISRASSAVASKRKKAADAQAAAGRTTSPSLARMKSSDAERATKEANAAESKRADLERKLAEAERKISQTRQKLDQERTRQLTADRKAQTKALDDLRRRTNQSTDAHSPRRLADRFPASGPPPPSDEGVGPRGGMRPPVPALTQVDYDVFLSHASEDTDDVARPLREALKARGVTVWFDEVRLRVGQSLRQQIERGIAGSRFGVVIISPSFLDKQWTQAELDALFGRKMRSGQDMVLPIWHHVSVDEVQRRSPILASIFALNTAVASIDEIADGLVEVVQARPADG